MARDDNIVTFTRHGVTATVAKDPTAAARAKRYRDRKRLERDGVTRDADRDANDDFINENNASVTDVTANVPPSAPVTPPEPEAPTVTPAITVPVTAAAWLAPAVTVPVTLRRSLMSWFGSRSGFAARAETPQPHFAYPYPPYPGYPPPPPAPPAHETPSGDRTRRLSGDALKHFTRASAGEQLWMLIAMGLSGWAAWVSVHGMVALFPAGGQTIVVGAAGMEALKIIGFMQLSAGRRAYSAFSRFAATVVLLVIAVVNAAGVYGWLYASHAGPSAQRAAQWQIQEADKAADIEVAQGKINDADERLRALAGLSRLTPGQRHELDDLNGARADARRELARLRASKHRLAAEQAVDEAASGPLRAATMLFIDLGVVPPDTKPEMLERILFGMILLSGDPAALIVLWTLGSRFRRR